MRSLASRLRYPRRHPQVFCGLVPGEGTTVMTKRTWILGMRTARSRAFAALVALSLATWHQRASALVVISADVENVSDDLREIAEGVAPEAMVDVLVGSSNTMTAAEQARIELLVTSMGGVVKRSSFASFNGYAASVPANKIAQLAGDTASDHVAPDRHVRPSMDVALPTIGAGQQPQAGGVSPFLTQIISNPIAPLTGKGVTVAVIDSGIASNPDLKTNLGVDRVIVRWSAMLGSATDEFGHGTHVAGIVGGNGKSS